MGLFGGANLPDLPNIDAQLNLMTELMQQFGREAEERRARLQPIEDSFISQLNDLVGKFAPEAVKAFDFADELRTLYRSTALPQEQRLFKDLQQYDTPQRRAFEFARAAGEVTSAANAQRQQEMVALRRAGVDPNDPRYAAARVQSANETGAIAAAAGRKAREDVEQTGVGRRVLATQIGRGWNSLADTSLNQGAGLLGTATSTLGAGYQTLAATGGRPIDYQSAQLGVANNYIDTLMQRYQAKMGRAAARSGAAGSLGGALGRVVGAGIGFGLGGGFGGGLTALQGALQGSQLFGGLAPGGQ